MCYETLVNGDATEKTVREQIREEMGSAVKDGAIAALAVLAVLVASQVALPLVAGAVVGAFVLGILLHQAVLVAGVALLRWRADGSQRPAPETA